MTGEQTEALIGMLVTLGLFAVMVLPSVAGIVRDRRIDREIRQAQQPAASRPAEPPAATWSAAGRRAKKLVSS
ncbi:hypothetical protein [Streptomyces fumanus]|nr:hypothetical protein [Streptomyces fumanus]